MKIDLHGTKHEDVSKKLDIFFWDAMKIGNSKVEIITGISKKMKDIVIDICNEYEFNTYEAAINPGSLIVKLI